jgi:hypothetical protein
LWIVNKIVIPVLTHSRYTPGEQNRLVWGTRLVTGANLPIQLDPSKRYRFWKVVPDHFKERQISFCIMQKNTDIIFSGVHFDFDVNFPYESLMTYEPRVLWG